MVGASASGPQPPRKRKQNLSVPLPHRLPNPAAAIAATTMPKRKKQNQQQQPPPQQLPLLKREKTEDEEDGIPTGEEPGRSVHISASGRGEGLGAEKVRGSGLQRKEEGRTRWGRGWRAYPGWSLERVEPSTSIWPLDLSKEGRGGQDKELGPREVAGCMTRIICVQTFTGKVEVYLSLNYRGGGELSGQLEKGWITSGCFG